MPSFPDDVGKTTNINAKETENLLDSKPLSLSVVASQGLLVPRQDLRKTT